MEDIRDKVQIASDNYWNNKEQLKKEIWWGIKAIAIIILCVFLKFMGS